MTPTIGRIVHYKLSERDAAVINQRRADAIAHARANIPAPGTSTNPGAPGRTGHVAHVGNRASAGDVCPAMVVRTFPGSGSSANLQVHLDGNDAYWATSAAEGDGEGQWIWPPRA